jgi:hypothetical protein
MIQRWGAEHQWSGSTFNWMKKGAQVMLHQSEVAVVTHSHTIED